MSRRGWAQVGVALLATGLLTAAGVAWRASAARQWREAVPGRPDLTAASAELRRRVEAAEPGWQAAAELPALAELARLYHANGYATAAEEAYRVLRERDSREPRWGHLGGLLLAGYGRLEEAEHWFRHALALAPDYVPARLKLAEVYLKTNRPAEAEREWRAVLAREPDSAWALHGLARLAAEDGRWPEARRLLEQATTVHPDFFAANNLLAITYETLGESEAAEHPRRRARAADRFREPADPWWEELDPYCHDVYQLQVMAAAAIDAGRSRRLLERARGLEPEDPQTLRQLAQLEFRQGAVAVARDLVEAAVALDPRAPDAYLDLVPIYHALGERDAAEQRLRAGLEHAPDSAGLHYELAMILTARERREEAIRHLETARRLAPAELAAYSKLAVLYFRSGQPAEAVAVIDAALAQDPAHGPALLLAARHRVSEGRAEEARDFLERARQADGATPEWHQVQREYQARFNP